MSNANVPYYIPSVTERSVHAVKSSALRDSSVRLIGDLQGDLYEKRRYNHRRSVHTVSQDPSSIDYFVVKKQWFNMFEDIAELLLSDVISQRADSMGGK